MKQDVKFHLLDESFNDLYAGDAGRLRLRPCAAQLPCVHYAIDDVDNLIGLTSLFEHTFRLSG